jgi:hypothetical protein
MANRERFTNNADSTLNGAINSSVTSITLTDATNFPATCFRISIEDEVLYCTSRSGNTLTVVRGSESTTAASHADLTPVTHLLTAGAVEQLKLDVFAMMGLGRKPTTGNTYGDEFDDESFTGWTAVRHATAPIDVVTEQDHMASMLIPTGGAAGQWNSYMKNCGTRSSGDEISMGVRMAFPNNGFPQPTLWFADGGTYNAGNQVGFAFSPHENTFVLRTETNYNNQTNFNNTVGGYFGANSIHDMNMKLKWNSGLSYTWGYSLDGIQWVTSTQNAITSFTPTWCGFGFTGWGASLSSIVCAFRYFRTSF